MTQLSQEKKLKSPMIARTAAIALLLFLGVFHNESTFAAAL